LKKFQRKKLKANNTKLVAGRSQRKIGSARRSSPHGLENQSGTARGKLPEFVNNK